MTRYIFPVLIALVLTGCGSSTSGPSEKVLRVQSDPVPTAKITIPKPIEKSPDDKQDSVGFGTLVISRDPTHPNPGCMMGVYLNKQLVHQFDADQRATFILPAGDQIVAVDNSDGRSSCKSVPGEKRELVLTINAGDVKNVRTQLLPDKGATIAVTER